jgi:hypothetical protein
MPRELDPRLIGVVVAFAVIGFIFIAFFTLDLGHVTSRLAHRYSEMYRKSPRFYKVVDPWLAATKTAYWRLFGGVFGAIALTFAALLVLTHQV